MNHKIHPTYPFIDLCLGQVHVDARAGGDVAYTGVPAARTAPAAAADTAQLPVLHPPARRQVLAATGVLFCLFIALLITSILPVQSRTFFLISR